MNKKYIIDRLKESMDVLKVSNCDYVRAKIEDLITYMNADGDFSDYKGIMVETNYTNNDWHPKAHMKDIKCMRCRCVLGETTEDTPPDNYVCDNCSKGVKSEDKEPETSIPHLLFKWEKEELDFRCGEELTLLREVAKNVDVYFDTPELNNNYPNLFDALYELDEFKKEQSNE